MRICVHILVKSLLQSDAVPLEKKTKMELSLTFNKATSPLDLDAVQINLASFNLTIRC